jgi:predicted murein hydrolase (TIGR00659 family)
MMLNWQGAWQTVLSSPYLGLLLTLLSFQFGLWIYQKSKQQPFLHPVFISVMSLVAVLLATDISYQHYMQSAQSISLFLGPVIVALAIPLYENLKLLKRFWFGFVLSNIIAGSVTILVAVSIIYLGSGSEVSLNTMWSKSITTAIAIEVAPSIGGLAPLAAAIVMFTGIFGALMAPSLFKLCGITQAPAQGCALGVCAHAVGTAKALELGSTQGAFAALSMSFMGLLCALLLPFLLG